MEDYIISELSNGEFIVLDILEITGQIEENMKSLLMQIYIESKQEFNNRYQNQDYSIELIILHDKKYLIIRGINSKKDKLISKIAEIKQLIKTSLETQEVENKKTVIEYIKQIAKKEKRTIAKSYKISNLQNSFLQECLTFDKIPTLEKNKITEVVKPDTAIIIDIIPTILTIGEIENIERLCNILGIIKEGTISSEITTTVSLAERPLELYNYYEKNKNGPLFTYNVLVCADNQEINVLTTLLDAKLSLGENEEHAEFKISKIENNEINIDKYFNSLPWVINEINLYKTKELGRMPYIITVEEANELLRI